MSYNWRKYDGPTVPSLLIEGRTASGWLMDNMYQISDDDFYNRDLSEQDLKDKYNDRHQTSCSD